MADSQDIRWLENGRHGYNMDEKEKDWISDIRAWFEWEKREETFSPTSQVRLKGGETALFS